MVLINWHFYLVDSRKNLFNNNVCSRCTTMLQGIITRCLRMKKIKSLALDSMKIHQQENMVHQLVIVFYHYIHLKLNMIAWYFSLDRFVCDFAWWFWYLMKNIVQSKRSVSSKILPQKWLHAFGDFTMVFLVLSANLLDFIRPNLFMMQHEFHYICFFLWFWFFHCQC